MLKKIIKKYTNLESLLVFIILFASFLVRVFRIDQLLGFYYDQGRDALVIWDLIYKGKFFLIGPTTGIEGIFRGPWYYWLITPFYFLGKGNPVYPSVFLSLTTVISIYILYYLAKEISGKTSGLVAIIIASFSYTLVSSARWLSNPTPMYLISMLFVLSLLLVLKKRKWAFPFATFLIGMAMQFGSAAEVFYIPFFIGFCIWQRKKLPNIKIILLGAVTFGISFLPQLIFDLRHQFILSKNIMKFLFVEKSFKFSFWQIFRVRLPFYYDVFTSLIWSIRNFSEIILMLLGVLFLVTRLKIYWKKDIFKTIVLLLVSPMIGMLFFQGNYGNVYGYYFTGYYLIFILFFSIIISSWSKNIFGKFILALFIVSFLVSNLSKVRTYIFTDVGDPKTIVLGNQKQAINWIYENAKGEKFNVDVYVPPVIPYAYDYLFMWYGQKTYGYIPSNERNILLYTLFEVDPPHPERLAAWLLRQKGIGNVLEENTIGGITVQKRIRIPNSNY
ncbi:MAG: glycosyltransferase family 39 protein [Patescibacteria group bacterium]